MQLTQIATLLNTVMVPNMFADNSGTTIAEDLRNVVDLGKPVSALSKSEFLDYAQKLAVGVVRTFFDGRQIGASTYGLEMDSLEYGGAVQRVKGKLLPAMSSAALNPVSYYDDNSAPSYIDGHAYFPQFDTSLFDTDVAFKVVHSTSEEKFKKMFNDRQGVIDWFAFVETIVSNSFENQMNQLAKAVIRKMALVADAGSRRVNLIPAFNTAMGFITTDPGYVTLATWDQSEAFKLFAQKVIIRLKKAMREYNKKFNNGTVPTFTPEADIRTILLSDFATSLDFANSSVFHKELVETGSYYEIEFFQDPSSSMIEFIGTNSKMDKIKETETDPTDPTKTVTTTLSYIVGLIYDKYAAGITTIMNDVGVEPVGAELFFNFHHHFGRKYFVDDRNACILICLDAEPSA